MQECVKFSIVMPAYNAGATIKKSIISVLDQSYPNWELIIIDDGSVDNTKDIINEFSKNNQKIKYYKQNNAGPGAARNLGMNLCEGDYIAFLDSDDYFDKDYLKCVYQECNKGDVDVVFTDRIYEDANGRIIGKTDIWKYRHFDKDFVLKCQMTGKIPWGVGKVFKTELYKRASGFTNLQVGEESIFSFDIVHNAKTISFVEKPILHVLRTLEGQHSKGNDDPWHPVVKVLCNHLIELGIYETYKKEINSFAMRSLSIAIYRNSLNVPYSIAIARFKNLLNKYLSDFELDSINSKVVEKSDIIIYFCLKHKLYFLLYGASRYRENKKIRKRKND